jgi:hypothetical protein
MLRSKGVSIPTSLQLGAESKIARISTFSEIAKVIPFSASGKGILF